jgi:transcriptional regulator with XRE-family HTH domain
MGRRPGITPNEARLRAHLAVKIRSAIGEDRGALSRTAKNLGLSKQALSLYLNEKATPSAETLRLLCSGLKLQLDIEGAVISASDLKPSLTVEHSQQLTLFEALSSVQSSQLQVSVVKRDGKSLDLKVSIDFTK